MKDYFVLKQDERLTDAPELLDARKQVNSRDIHLTSAHKLADTMFFKVKAEKQSIFPDVMDRQLYLISERLKRLVELYAPDTIFKLTPLIDMAHRRQHNYYLPIFEEVSALSPNSERAGDGRVIRKLVLQGDQLTGKRIFKIKESEKPLIVVRLDVAESILRRDFEGVQLVRVQVE
ncbi:hypothetical protein [Paenibacillus alba]|uniref:Uncharacterized protein n=1 Tax=Paenibacillus alba TaxID=1197127 RepID=A0ABU6FWM3_9BACL|nr:hypothetical protein [Paenibacillus alba]MEC0226301.1 hypothetical protein [Paenibacillus alba]